ncbi:MAG: pirin family protein [Rhizobiaceae bacterium]
MSFFPGTDPDPGDAFACDAIETLVVSSAKDIGGFAVRRALPTARRRMVGPFIFFDQMGPAILTPGKMLDVRPHPHIGLATVTYLFEGQIRHRDSLGSDMVIAPGDVNLMAAGRGIVHSERTPEDMRGAPMAMSGLQTWIALPEWAEDMAPAFASVPALALPEHREKALGLRVIMGSFGGMASPAPTYSGTTYVDVRLGAGGVLDLPADIEERAIYTLAGTIDVEGDSFGSNQLIVFKPGAPVRLTAKAGAHCVLLGGDSIGSKRYIWWNFVSSSQDKIEQAKQEWRTGKFDIVPGDEEEFIPLPG